MPRLTDTHYLELHGMLRHYWLENRFVYGILPISGQQAIHDYFQPSKDLTEEQLIAHRRVVSTTNSSLPQRAGRAFKHFEQAVQYATQYQARRETMNGKKRKPLGKVRIFPVIRPEPDYHKLARALLSEARFQIAAGTDVRGKRGFE